MEKMHHILSLLKTVFNSDAVEAVPLEGAKQCERDLVSMFARGNLNLQFGRYTTGEDLDHIKTSFRDYRFSPSE